MYNDAHLPDTDAWVAITRDLRQSKESRNALSRENSYVPHDRSRGRTLTRVYPLSQATQATVGGNRI